VTEDHNLNGINERISTRGYFERILNERDKRELERDRRLDERFDAQEKAVAAALAAAEKAVNAALSAAEKAVTKSEEAQLRVNVTQNEFRGTLKDQAADLMPRSETELLVKDLRDKVEKLSEVKDQTLGRQAGVQLSAGYLFAILAGLGTVFSIVAYIATH
jgi:hypothetical protein